MKKTIFRRCIQCSKKITLKSGSLAFCSIDCKLQSLSKNIEKKENPYDLKGYSRPYKPKRIPKALKKKHRVELIQQKQGPSRRAKLRAENLKLLDENSRLRSALEKKEKRVGFYHSREWLSVRYPILKAHIQKHGHLCLVCRQSGVTLHVDHIKPRSKFPELELSPDNLQILCEACNLGKSNLDETDWRSE